MKRIIVAVFLLFSIFQIYAQSSFRINRLPMQCNTRALLGVPKSVVESIDFLIRVIPKVPNHVSYVELRIDGRLIGRKNDGNYTWKIIPDFHIRGPGLHKAQAKLVTKCGNSSTWERTFRVDKLR